MRRGGILGVARRFLACCVNGSGWWNPEMGPPKPRNPTHAWLSVGSNPWWDATMDECPAC